MAVTSEQMLVVGILAASVGMFLWGRWRHDMVAVGALLACVVGGAVLPAEAFSGFGHPAVITVACVLVLSHGLQTSGAVDGLVRLVLPARAGRVTSLLALLGLGALLSGFMNNVGAMALLMPVAIQLARRLELAPGQVLMPLAFGTILGGMTTLIGTPPNMIVSGFRAQVGEASFGMFDFAPVGLGVASAGVVFVAWVGWRLVPARRQTGMEGFDSGAYLTEARLIDGSSSDGKTLGALECALDASGAQIVGLVRNDTRIVAPSPSRRLRAGDILVIEAEAEALAGVLSSLQLKLEESVRPGSSAESAIQVDGNRSDPASARVEDSSGQALEDAPADQDDPTRPELTEVVLMELVVLPGSSLSGRSASDILLRTRYGINLLALSRQGRRSTTRLRDTRLASGDLLLMQGPADAIGQFASDNACVPLAERELRIPSLRKAWTASIIMVLAVGGAAFGLLPASISFAMGVLASMVLRTVPARAVYGAIDWPVIVLLAALIPVAGAMASTGAADLIARVILDHLAQGHAVTALVLILLVTMFLSDLMNNAATAAVMCPIAIGTASGLGVGPDAFLMAVAIGASCAFLTPIGHQNNTLILGPGGFRFGDYWRLGLPLELLVVLVSVPMLLLVWPL
ncbi:MAG TPA: SLC13 family permease [Hydrogenophaga sp.]|uniref:SLC13 family permease n=1 Tax=Hydrogenophaga sp. TaxID=1904254 RepID=UPI002B89F4AD|nr:SLC13 family permease [Hydrogenophaga sp.]HMN94571.1 SLC13 family permease [Hydrogenophaga sp.]HMP10061.1 SLC13 family permease [Hydrogenophaga sp.]